MVVKVLLQALVGKVDAELLEGVVFEDFESKYVEDSDVPHPCLLSLAARERLFVDARHNPAKQSVIQCFCDRISVVVCLLLLLCHIFLVST